MKDQPTFREGLLVAGATPWKLWNEVVRIALEPFMRAYFWSAGIAWGSNWKIYGFPILQITKGSRVEIGGNLELRSSYWSNPLAPFHPVVLSTRSVTAQLRIGSDFKMTGGSVVAENKITIGDSVAIGANSDIIDTDFHPLDAQKRKSNFLSGKTAPVVIGSHVFVGTRSIILKGTILGTGCVVGAGSVVSGKIPPHAIVVSNAIKIQTQSK